MRKRKLQVKTVIFETVKRQKYLSAGIFCAVVGAILWRWCRRSFSHALSIRLQQEKRLHVPFCFSILPRLPLPVFWSQQEKGF